MPRYSLHPSPPYGEPLLPAQRDASCDLYSPGHQIHYRHQGDAVRSPSRSVANAILDGTRLTLVLDDATELTWQHHDPVRLRRILELVPSKRVAYPKFHALRVGPYWFNCAPGSELFEGCGLSTPTGPA